jgi:hypothetical protein
VEEEALGVRHICTLFAMKTIAGVLASLVAFAAYANAAEQHCDPGYALIAPLLQPSSNLCAPRRMWIPIVAVQV